MQTLPSGVHVLPDADAVAATAAREVLRVVRSAVDARGHVSIALAGGSTPRGLYTQLAAAGRAAAPWDQALFAFGDERMVPPSSDKSNQHLARRALFEPLGISPAQVIGIDTTAGDGAAAGYESALANHFGDQTPRFDLILLGVGADGHTASLFADGGLRVAPRGWAAMVTGPSRVDIRERVSLTLHVINNAAVVFILATGASKRAAVKTALDPGSAPTSPAGQVGPAGRLAWFLDRDAAPDL